MTLKEFVYRGSISVMCKSSLNFGMIMLSLTGKEKDDESFDLQKLMSQIPKKQKSATQMQKLERKNIIRVAIVDEKAYFVHENTFYTAAIVDGEVDRSSASPINAIDMSKKEMNKLLSILDNMY